MSANANDPISGDWRVICLCAQWCGVCRDWRGVFEQAALAHPHLQFAWVDVEDQAQAMGDVEIETFPTLLAAQGAHVHFFGPIQPSAAQLSRLLASLMREPAPQESTEAAALLKRLASAAP